MFKRIIFWILIMALSPSFVLAQQETNALERFGIDADSVLPNLGDWAEKIAVSVLILIVFWILAIIVRKIIRKAGAATGIDSSVVNLLARVANVGLWLVGLVTALGTVGINVSAIVASLGLTGFAVGFALKDSISNLLSGVLILIYRPFRVGQWISVKSFEGFVMAIDLRYTSLEQGDEKILVPNSLLFTNPISIRSNSEKEN